MLVLDESASTDAGPVSSDLPAALRPRWSTNDAVQCRWLGCGGARFAHGRGRACGGAWPKKWSFAPTRARAFLPRAGAQVPASRKVLRVTPAVGASDGARVRSTQQNFSF